MNSLFIGLAGFVAGVFVNQCYNKPKTLQERKEKAMQEYIIAKTDWEFTKAEVEKGNMVAVPYEPKFHRAFVEKKVTLQILLNEEARCRA